MAEQLICIPVLTMSLQTLNWHHAEIGTKKTITPQHVLTNVHENEFAKIRILYLLQQRTPLLEKCDIVTTKTCCMMIYGSCPVFTKDKL